MSYPADSIEFLTGVWKDQGTNGYVALSTKEDASVKDSPWRDYTFPLDDTLPEKLEEWFLKHASKDKYFCPLIFSGPRRSKNLVNPSNFLWSDIDEGDHTKCEPSILWETSPGRFAGLWRVSRLNPLEASEKSKAVARYIGGDKGGHDLTQVLRIPGTHNGKYEDRPIVKLTHFTDRILRKVPQSLIDRWRSTIPKKVMRIIEGPVEVGKRSDMLWYLEHELCDLGIPIKDVFSILRNTDWNKYRGREDEDERFNSEMEKIRADRGEKGAVTRIDSVKLVVVDYAQLLASTQSEPGWLVKDFWMKGSHGIIAGEPKSFKSTLGMDMLFSVASGTKFLEEFPVDNGGPILVIQNENADWIMKDRLEKMAFSRGEVGRVKTTDGKKLIIEWARKLPMFFINQQSFMLDDAANKEALEDLIDRMRPVAIKLDPLYLMFSGDVNSAKDLSPVLQWALYIKQKYNCAVILVHHYGKGSAEKRGGQRMLGSTTLHGWIESAWYMQAQEPQDGKAIVTLEREFRGSGVNGKVDIHISMGEAGKSPNYQALKRDHTSRGVVSEQGILDILSIKNITLKEIASQTNWDKPQVGRILREMVDDGKVIKDGNMYGLKE